MSDNEGRKTRSTLVKDECITGDPILKDPVNMWFQIRKIFASTIVQIDPLILLQGKASDLSHPFYSVVSFSPWSFYIVPTQVHYTGQYFEFGE